jgi:hypothetical protein
VGGVLPQRRRTAVPPTPPHNAHKDETMSKPTSHAPTRAMSKHIKARKVKAAGGCSQMQA